MAPISQNRRPITKSELKRRRANRGTRSTVLIVTEGTKTEKIYFDDLVQYHKLIAVDVKPSSGTDPVSVVRYAISLAERAKNIGNEYDSIFCIIDRDSHLNYQQACDIVNGKKHKLNIVLITSTPCFEVWYCCHYGCSTRPYSRMGKLSICDCVKKDLIKNWPDYDKSFKNTYTYLLDRVEAAIKNAERQLAFAETAGTRNPSTEVHLVVSILRDISSSK